MQQLDKEIEGLKSDIHKLNHEKNEKDEIIISKDQDISK